MVSHIPGDLPMRDGNFLPIDCSANRTRPGDLPMRDGNPRHIDRRMS